MNKKCSIIGLGWYGIPLALNLLQEEFNVMGSTRSVQKQKELQTLGIDATILEYPESPSESLMDADIVVLNIPPFSEQLSWFKNWNWDQKTWVLFVSSISVFPTADSISAKLLEEQEAWIQSRFTNWTILRLGGLLGNGRHPGKHLSGKKNLQGRLWPVNLIHQEDAVNFTQMVIKENLKSKIYHVVSDEHPTREDFYTSYCHENNLPLPEFDQSDFSVGKNVPSLKIYDKFHKLI